MELLSSDIDLIYIYKNILYEIILNFHEFKEERYSLCFKFIFNKYYELKEKYSEILDEDEPEYFPSGTLNSILNFAIENDMYDIIQFMIVNMKIPFIYNSMSFAKTVKMKVFIKELGCDWDGIKKVITDGDLKLFIELGEIGYPFDESILNYSAFNKQFDIVNYLHDKKYRFNKTFSNQIIKIKDLELLKYFLHYYPYLKEYIYTFLEHAIEYKTFEIFTYLIDTYNLPWTENLSEIAVKYDFMEIIYYAKDKGLPLSDNLCDIAILNGCAYYTFVRLHEEFLCPLPTEIKDSYRKRRKIMEYLERAQEEILC
jgi:glutaredoxin-related protein